MEKTTSLRPITFDLPPFFSGESTSRHLRTSSGTTPPPRLHFTPWPLSDLHRSLLPAVRHHNPVLQSMTIPLHRQLPIPPAQIPRQLPPLFLLSVANSKKFSKTLSDYMLYLLIMQPTMMSAVPRPGSSLRKRSPCCDWILGYFSGKKKMKNSKYCYSEEMMDACEKIWEVNTEVDPVAIKGNRSKSVLFVGCRPAKKLMEMKERKWEIMSRKWVEMLCYAVVIL
ncbi:hypothetical protein C2S51_027539 [Perilla frutescens var. frutescens]|nr:hypothetical protein C2S51_027539 [Perilla frutescens var. frutescens]